MFILRKIINDTNWKANNMNRIIPYILFATAISIGIPYGIYRYKKIINHTEKQQNNGTAAPGTHQKSAEGITVFIHGTTGSTLNFCEPIKCFSNSASLEEKPGEEERPDFTKKVVESYRNHPAMSYDQILGPEGFYIWEDNKNQIQDAATYLIPAYKKIAKIAGVSAEHETYATFGWSGILSQKARKKSGFELYHALIDYQKKQQLNGKKEARIRLITHSHGGNVALWLAKAEEVFKKGLQVETLVMLGAPIQIETAEYIKSPLFTNIYLLYSIGDSVQRSDCISTRTHKSFARMQDLVDLKSLEKTSGLHRHDILLGINKNANQITHINMWLSGRSKKLASALGPLPLFVLIPTIFQLNQKERLPIQSKISFDIKQGTVELAYYHHAYREHLSHHITWDEVDKIGAFKASSKKLYRAISYWSNRMNEEWRQYDKSRNILWNKKNLDIIKSVLW